MGCRTRGPVGACVAEQVACVLKRPAIPYSAHLSEVGLRSRLRGNLEHVADHAWSRAPAGRAATPAEVIGGRYRLEGKLGGGGMAQVFAALDMTTGRRLALKRPQVAAGTEQRMRVHQLFEREFHTLSQLSHPRIVAAYDYGVDERGPYYTMELLDGGDLQQLVPADYRRVCAIARDVCSALSLLHSRRIVHRDISPRNIRCTADGTAKLIDFGAMTAMGATRDLVGTPVCCAPEALHLQALDARTDLYALGATLYYALTGRHAYPAREFFSLPNAWTFEPPRPSELADAIPPGLDELVLHLLQLDAASRPSNAAEVMERLAAIEGRPLDEQLLVAQAYLSTPSFVGREAELSAVEAKLDHALRGRGSALLVSGAPGVGRSRFLDACVLAAKLRGMSVARADAGDAEHGDFGAMRGLVLRLQQALPGLVGELGEAELPVLVHVIPQLGAGLLVPPATFPDAQALREAFQNALRNLLLKAAERSPLLVAVDDLPNVDEPSVAMLALLARDLNEAALMLVATSAASEAGPTSRPAHAMYAGAATKIDLSPLDLAHTLTLLESVFGASAQLDALGRRLYRVAQGNPRDILRLAQHLVDRGVVRYAAGSWSVPSHIDTTDLPSSIAQALCARIEALEPAARRLACAFALSPDHGLSVADCGLICEGVSAAQRFRHLEQLQHAEVLRESGDRFSVADRAWIPLLLSACSAAEQRELHLALARLLEQRLDDEWFRIAQHVLRAGERERALDLFVRNTALSQEQTDRDSAAFSALVKSLPADWLATCEEAIGLCDRLNRPKKHAFVLGLRAIGLVAVLGVRDCVYRERVIAQLRAASGLDDWAALDAAHEPTQRLTLALEAAQARYDATPERDRIVDPLGALRLLGGAIRAAVGISAPLLDLASLRALPSLAPLAPLAPSLLVLDKLLQGVEARLTGRLDRARELYLDLLERRLGPEAAGLSATYNHHARIRIMNGLGMIEAAMGLDSSLEWATQIEADAFYRSHGTLIRIIHRLWQGRSHEVERLKKQLEVLRLRSSTAQSFESTYLLWQVTAYAAMDDLIRLKRTHEEIAAVAADHPGWQPVLAYSEAEYQRVRGDSASAVTQLAHVLEGVRAGEHQLWPNLAGAHVRSLDEAGRSAEAVAFGTQYLAEAERALIGFNTNAILLPLCTAEAKCGNPAARLHAQRAIADFERIGTTGLNLGLAYEACARVALVQGDLAAYHAYLERCELVFGGSADATLAAKVQKLRRESQTSRALA